MSISAKHQSSSLIPNSDALHLHLLTVADNITCAFFITATYLEALKIFNTPLPRVSSQSTFVI